MFGLAVLVGSLGCSANIFETFADKESNAAKIQEIQIRLNKSDFDGALAIIATLPPAVQNDRDVRVLAASAYAGRSGLVFLSMIENFQNASSTLISPFLMSGFPRGTSAKISDAIAAEQQLAAISTDASVRTSDENVIMALVNFAKMGNILSEYADDDEDGTLDGTFNPCPNADTPGTNISNAQVREFGLSLVFALNSLSSLSNNFASSVLGGLSSCLDIEALDDSMPVHPLDGMCAITDAADFTSDHLAGFRSIIKENSVFGLGIGGGGGCPGDISTCNCPP